MPIHVRLDGDIAILNNVGTTMNDPRYFDAAQEVGDLPSQGFRLFVIKLRGANDPGSPLLGLLMTMTRQITFRRPKSISPPEILHLVLSA